MEDPGYVELLGIPLVSVVATVVYKSTHQACHVMNVYSTLKSFGEISMKDIGRYLS